VRNSLPCLTAPLPFPPDDPNTPVYALGGDQFLADETATPLIPPLARPYSHRTLSPADYAAIVQAQADEVLSFVAQTQARQQRAQLSRNGNMSALDWGIPPLPGEGGGDGTNYWEGGSTPKGPPPGTNDLWLEILSMSVSNATAHLVIHPPWNVTNGVYDLLYCTDLAPPISWQWLLRTDPGQTNLPAVSAPPPQGFYRLGLPNDLVPPDSLGTNFWVVFFSVYDISGPNLSLYISSAVGATGMVTVPGLGITNAFSVAAGAVTNISLDPSVMMAEYDVVETNGIHITASQPVAVYGVDFSFWTTCSFTGYPTTLLGTNYCVMARASMDDWPGDENTNSQFAIVATADNTTVTNTPSPTAHLYGHTNAYTKILQQGETYQINSTDMMGDVTGTWITSDKPVAVFAGAGCAWVPDANYYAGDPLVQEQLPVDTWGKQALALSFAGRQYGDTYRVLAAYSNTVVLVNGVVAGTIQAGEYLDFILDGPVEFQASQPIQVAHFANGLYFDGEGDPCEILLPPAGHYLLTNIVFTLPGDWNTGDFATNYLNIIVPQLAITNTLVDGSTVDATNFVPIGTSGYYGAQISVTNAVDGATTHTVTSSQPVGVEVYGFGPYDAYGCFGGVVK
jgi:hypothetical protein